MRRRSEPIAEPEDHPVNTSMIEEEEDENPQDAPTPLARTAEIEQTPPNTATMKEEGHGIQPPQTTPEKGKGAEEVPTGTAAIPKGLTCEKHKEEGMHNLEKKDLSRAEKERAER